MTRRWLAVLALVQVVLLVAATGAAGKRFLAAPLDDDGAYVLLVLGSDLGPPRPGTVLEGRADGFHLVVVTPTRDAVTIVSFPRDSWVSIPGLGRSKINAALTRGPQTAVATAEALTGLEVDDWLVTGFDGFIAAIDELDGVEIDVEERLLDPRGASSDLQPGRQRLVGWQALSYTRDRTSRSGGDLARAESHARMMQALHAQVVGEDPGALRIAELVSTLRRHTVTSIPPARLFQLADTALSIDPAAVTRVRLDGSVGTAGRASVIHLAPSAERLFADLRTDGLLDR